MQPRVEAHNPQWLEDYAREAAALTAALADTLVAVHHIGSTAIPTMVAKPIIDILLEVTSVQQLDEASDAMRDLGYEVMGEFGLVGRRYFRKCNAAGERSHHVHAWRQGDPEALRHLAFRDYLLAHPEQAKDYSALKQKLAHTYPNDMASYIDGKDAFIKTTEARALAWRDSGSPT